MPKKNSTSKQSSFQKDFEALEQLVERFESGDLDIDVALKEFEKGLQLAEQLSESLKKTENKIEQLRSKYSIDE